MYSSTLSLTSALDGSEWSTPCSGRFTLRKEIHCIGGWVGPEGWSGHVWKTSPTKGFEPRTDLHVASRYIDKTLPTAANYLKY